MAWSDVPTVIKQIWNYFHGDQTRKEASIEAEGDTALKAAKTAQTADQLNAADAELHRVHDRARATRSE